MKHLMIAFSLVSMLTLVSSAARADDTDPDAVADRLRNDAARADNGGDSDRAAEARAAADHAASSDVDHAREVERDYNAGRDHDDHDHGDDGAGGSGGDDGNGDLGGE